MTKLQTRFIGGLRPTLSGCGYHDILSNILLATAVAWVGAKITAEHVFGSIQQMLVEIAPGGTTFPTINFMLAVSGVLGGLVGSTTLTFGLSLVCKEFGAFENWARIVMPGTVLGVLLELGAKDDKLSSAYRKHASSIPRMAGDRRGCHWVLHRSADWRLQTRTSVGPEAEPERLAPSFIFGPAQVGHVAQAT
jgi:hypothetical protein